MTDPSGLEDILVKLTERVLSGETVDLDDALREHPLDAEGIRKAWPGILHLVVTLDGDPGRSSTDTPVPRGYRARGPVHTGGQGTIVEVVEESSGTRAAFKVMTRGRQDALREMLAFERLREEHHPSIVRVHSVSASGILMEFLDGPDLDDLVDLDEGPGDVAVSGLSRELGAERPAYRKVARAFAGLSRGLSTLHERGILHRDLKPQNIKVVASRGLVLFDLGIARIDTVETISDPDTVLGTLPFLAPEAVPGSDQSFDERTDVYGLGATLYTILTNRYPHSGRNVIECLESVRTQDPPRIRTLNPNVPGGLADIAERTVSRQPESRYETALEVAEDLERFAAGRPVRAELSQIARQRQRRSFRLGILVAVVVLTLTGFGVWQFVAGLADAHRRQEEEARATRFGSLLADARDLHAKRRTPEALVLAEDATELANGPAEEFASALLRARLLGAQGMIPAAAAILTPLMDGDGMPDVRRAARIGLAEIHFDAADYRAAYRLLVDRDEARDPVGGPLLLDCVLNLGRAGQARRILEGMEDPWTSTLIDRFQPLLRLPVPGLERLAVVKDDRERGTIVLGSPETGEVYRFDPDREESLVRMHYEGDPILHLSLRPTGVPGELAITGRDEDEDVGAVAVVDVATGRTLHRWDGLRSYPRYSTMDLDGDGLLEHIIHYQVCDRGIDIFGPDGEPLPLGDLDELNRANADVRGVFRFEESGLVLVVTGPWNVTGLGFSLLSYRWRAGGGFERVARRRIGDIQGGCAADLDGDGEPEIYVSVYHRPTRDLCHVFPEFVKPGIYRLDPIALAIEPVVVENRLAACIGPTGELRQVDPLRNANRLTPVRLGAGREGIVCSVQERVPGRYRSDQLRVLAADGSGARFFTVPSAQFSELDLSVGDILPDSPGQEVATVSAGELRLFGARGSSAMAGQGTTAGVRLTGSSPPSRSWFARDRRTFVAVQEEGVHVVTRSDRNDRLVHAAQLTGGAFRFRARLTIREMGWGGEVFIGVFGTTPKEDEKIQHLCLNLRRSSYAPRGLYLEYLGEKPRHLVQSLEAPNSFDLAWGTPLDCVVEYDPDPPSVLVTIRNERTGAILHRIDRRLPSPLLPGNYDCGIISRLGPGIGKDTVQLELRELEFLGLGESGLEPIMAVSERDSSRVAVEQAHSALLAGDRTEARKALLAAPNKAKDLAALLVGPFATPALPLALLALEDGPPSLRDHLIRLSTAGGRSPLDPELALGLFDATGVREGEKGQLVEVLCALGRTREAFLLAEPAEEMTIPDSLDTPARLSYASAALDRLQPTVAEALIEPFLTSPPTIRARIDALRLGARAALMSGNRTRARDLIDRLLAIPGVAAEQLMDDSDLRLFLRENR